MNKSGMLTLSVPLLVVGLAAYGQPALAHDAHQLHRLSPRTAGAGQRTLLDAATTAPPALTALQATFTQDTASTGENADGSDLWPCFGAPTPEADCPTVGDPTVPMPNGAAVLGFPSYEWLLQAPPPDSLSNTSGNGCDALTNGTTGPSGSAYKPCTQIATWYEDNTNDTTDDLLQKIVVTQGSKVIYDSGTADFGPAAVTTTYPVDVILFSDANFGYWPGASSGPNNGNCSANISYPLTAPSFPGGYYVVASNATCQEPAPGPATVRTVTLLATPQYSEVTGAACTSRGVASPCYTVKWTTKYQIKQDFNVFFE